MILGGERDVQLFGSHLPASVICTHLDQTWVTPDRIYEK
jgi:hypothetical protein